MYILLQNSV